MDNLCNTFKDPDGVPPHPVGVYEIIYEVL
jgi:hypothetical protein